MASPALTLTLKSLSRVQLFATPWTVAYQAPPFMEFSRQEYWSGLPFPSPGDLPEPGIEPGSPALQADALPSEPPGKSKWTCLPSWTHLILIGLCYVLRLCDSFKSCVVPLLFLLQRNTDSLSIYLGIL